MNVPLPQSHKVEFNVSNLSAILVWITVIQGRSTGVKASTYHDQAVFLPVKCSTIMKIGTIPVVSRKLVCDINKASSLGVNLKTWSAISKTAMR